MLKRLLKHEDLFKMMLNSASYKQLDIQKVDEKIKIEEIINFQDFQEAQRPSEKEELIIDAYFIHKIKPHEIASRFRMSRSKVYKVVEEVKKTSDKSKYEQIKSIKKVTTKRY